MSHWDISGINQYNNHIENLRTQLYEAGRAQELINNAVNENNVERINAGYSRLNAIIGNTERYIRNNTNAQGRFNQSIEESEKSANSLMQAVKGIGAAYLTIQTVNKVVGLSDEMIQTTARLNLIVDDGGSVEELQNKIMASAERARGSYMTTADAVSKLGMQAAQAFSNNDELIAFTELLNKQFVIAGTAAQGIDSVMLQLTQSMASGKLQGEELRSVMTNAQPIVAGIEKYLKEIEGVDVSNFKKMAADGQITADIIKNSMFYMADDINAKFESMPMTWGQVWNSFKNFALSSFQSVLGKINEVANSDGLQKFAGTAKNALSGLGTAVSKIFNSILGIGSFISSNWGTAIENIIYSVVFALQTFSDVLSWLIEKAVSFAQVIVDNWSWISPIIYGITAELIFYNAVLGIGWLTTLKDIIVKGLHAAASAAQAVALFAVTAAQHGLNAAMYACPVTQIIMAIIALVAIFYAAVAAVNKFAGTSVSATGIVMAAFLVFGAFVINQFIGIWNMIASFVNFFVNACNGSTEAVKVLFYDMALTVLGYIKNLAKGIEDLINSIPGIKISITSGLNNLYSELAKGQAKVKNESEWKEYVKKLNYIDYGDAAKKGYEFGKGLADKISNFNPSDLFNKNNDESGLNDLSSLINKAGLGVGNAGKGLGAGSGAGKGLDDIGKGVNDIAKDVGSISDSVDLTEENLKNMRDIAEQEAVNEYMTKLVVPDVKITFTGDIRETADVNVLVDAVKENIISELTAGAEMAHA